MKTFKDILAETAETFKVIDTIIDDMNEGKTKIKKVVKDSKGKFHKKITYTCDKGQKYNSNTKKCEHISGSQKQAMKKGAKKRTKKLAVKSTGKKEREQRQRAKANKKFNI